ncbi:MAG: hypothetical protein ACH0QD_13210 [Tepidibacillus sp.]
MLRRIESNVEGVRIEEDGSYFFVSLPQFGAISTEIGVAISLLLDDQTIFQDIAYVFEPVTRKQEDFPEKEFRKKIKREILTWPSINNVTPIYGIEWNPNEFEVLTLPNALT